MSTPSDATAAINTLTEAIAPFIEQRVLAAQTLAQQKKDQLAAEQLAYDQFPRPLDFLISTPLYEKVLFCDELTWPVLDMLYFNATFDCYCVECGQMATFKGAQGSRPSEHTRNVQIERFHASEGITYKHPVLSKKIHEVNTNCTRNPVHRQRFLFLVQNETNGQSIQKIGQFPSYADIHVGDLKGYRQVLTKNQMNELSKAIGLSSHGIGIGSFVYLRRIFEALVEQAHLAAKADAGWDEVAYTKLYMGEKISALKAHLPEYMSKNSVLYSVLSKGIHELSEEECLKYFAAVKISIEMILDEKLELKKRTDKIKAAQSALHFVAVQTQ